MANAVVTALAPSLGSGALRLLARTLRIRREEKATEPLWTSRTPAIYVVWHARLLLLPYLYGHRGARVLISRSRDGEMVARRGGGPAGAGASSRRGPQCHRSARRSAGTCGNREARRGGVGAHDGRARGAAGLRRLGGVADEVVGRVSNPEALRPVCRPLR